MEPSDTKRTSAAEPSPYEYEAFLVNPATGPSLPRSKGWLFCAVGCILLAMLAPMLLWAYWGCLTLPLHHLAVGPLTSGEGGTLRVLTYNVFLRMKFGVDKESAAYDDWKNERAGALIPALAAYDVVALQEAWLVLDEGRTARILRDAEKAGFTYWARAPCELWKCPTNAMLLVLSKHPLQDVEFTSYHSCSGEDCLADKGALAVTVVPFGNPDCAFSLVNTHMDASLHASRPGDALPEAQAKQLAEVVARRNQTRPVLVSGDLNMEARGPLWQKISQAYFPTLQDVGTRAGTFFGGLRQPEPDAAERLDYLLWRPEAQQGLSQVPDSSRVDRFDVRGKPFATLSDHFGTSTVLRCAQPAPRLVAAGTQEVRPAREAKPKEAVELGPPGVRVGESLMQKFRRAGP